MRPVFLSVCMIFWHVSVLMIGEISACGTWYDTFMTI